MTAFGGALTDPTKIMGSRVGAYLVDAVISTIVVLGLFYGQLFSIPAGSGSKALFLLAILGGRSCLVSLPLALFRGALFGDQRIVLINIVQILTHLGLALGTVFVLEGEGREVLTVRQGVDANRGRTAHPWARGLERSHSDRDQIGRKRRRRFEMDSLSSRVVVFFESNGRVRKDTLVLLCRDPDSVARLDAGFVETGEET